MSNEHAQKIAAAAVRLDVETKQLWECSRLGQRQATRDAKRAVDTAQTALDEAIAAAAESPR